VDPGPIYIILLSPVYFTRTVYFTCILYYFPLDTLIIFVSSKPVRLTTSSQVGNKVFGCVCAGSALLLAEDESTSIVKRRPCWSVIKPVRITFSHHRLSSSRSTLNLGILTEGKLAAILIIPSSWGSQRAGYSPRTRTYCSTLATSFLAPSTSSKVSGGAHRGERRGNTSGRRWDRRTTSESTKIAIGVCELRCLNPRSLAAERSKGAGEEVEGVRGLNRRRFLEEGAGFGARMARSGGRERTRAEAGLLPELDDDLKGGLHLSASGLGRTYRFGCVPGWAVGLFRS
jgi:hypothetical protein